jgi:hypothetical protein
MPNLQTLAMPQPHLLPLMYRGCKKYRMSELEVYKNTCYILVPYLLAPWSRVLLEQLTGFAANQEIHRILWNSKVHYRTHKRILVPKSFIKFMFLTVYRVTQKYFYAHPYTSMWSPVVPPQISKLYSSSCHVFISM